jgi:dihydropteroate synthase
VTLADTRSAFRCGRFEFTLERPLLMGVLNLTPDSFSDGGRFMDAAEAIAHGRAMVEAGADILDIGAESTRPGAPTVPFREEMARLEPVVAALSACGRPLSVDTRNPEVMRQVVAMGVDMINDVAGFRSDAAIDAVRDAQVACCVMHMRGDPATMQQSAHYGDVVAEVGAFLHERAAALEAAGVARSRIVVDPGIGFGKTLAHNLALLARLPELAAGGLPVLVGLSRKSMVGTITGREVGERLAGSLGGMLAAVARGARIVRVHDVAQSRDALAVWQAVASGG